MKILIVDDHALVRQGLRLLLQDEFENVVIEAAGNASNALELAASQKFDVVVLDLNLPGRSGFEVLQELKQRQPELPVLVLTAYPEDQLSIRTLAAGAAGYVTKQSANEDLVNAVRKVLSGKTYVSVELAEKIAGRIRRGVASAPHENLSPREFEVMTKLATGRSLTEIAEELSLSVKTISTFRTRVMRKLGLNNNVELAHYAAERNLVVRISPASPPDSMP